MLAFAFRLARKNMPELNFHMMRRPSVDGIDVVNRKHSDVGAVVSLLVARAYSGCLKHIGLRSQH
jgi:hypothetical protein